jgi:uncharacterized protein (TIGR00730 family)
VFCGSAPGVRASYALAATRLGELLAERGLTLVYGGAHRGLMGSIADAALARGGRVEGVIPDFLAGKEIAHTQLAELEIVTSMHARKASMAARSDAFVAMPGGFGTLEELFEILTWGQLELHHKPCALLNIDGFFDSLLGYLDHACAEGLLRPEYRAMVLVETDPERLLALLEAHATAGETLVTPERT